MDFRKLNEEQFKEVLIDFMEETNNFKEFDPEIIIENIQSLLITRICLGLSQKEFARKMNRTKDNIRHLESGRRYICKKAIANEYAYHIKSLMRKRDISIEKAIENWRKYCFISRDQNLPEPEIKVKQISKLNEEEFKEFFELIRKETENFKKFDPNFLVRIPQSVMVFRVVLGINHRKFARILNINSRGLRKYEKLEMKIKPATSKRLMKIIRNLYSEKSDVSLENVLENFRVFKNFYGTRNLKSCMNQGLTVLAMKRSPIELKIENIFKRSGIPFENNVIIEGNKKRYNVDFVIPNSKKPKIVIECFEAVKKTTNRIWKYRVCLVDHRFRSIKLKYPKIKSMMIIDFSGRPILHDFMKKRIEMELMDTDFCIINKDIDKIPDIVQNT